MQDLRSPQNKNVGSNYNTDSAGGEAQEDEIYKAGGAEARTVSVAISRLYSASSD